WAKLASVTGWGRPTGSAARHLPQTGARPAATLSAATRLVAPQAGQRIIKGSTAGAPSAVILPRPARRRQRHDALECAGHAVLRLAAGGRTPRGRGLRPVRAGVRGGLQGLR